MMSRAVVPRLCRQMRALQQCPTRHMSFKRNLPTFWTGRRRPLDDIFPVGQNFFDSEIRNAFDQMQKLMSPRIFNYDPFTRSRALMERFADTDAEVKYDDKSFEVKLDVQQYSPEELNVKITEDRLIIAGKHEQKADKHGFISREFTREFVIPQDVDMDSFASSLSENGIMTIQARVKGSEKPKERTINIEKVKNEKDQTDKDAKESQTETK